MSSQRMTPALKDQLLSSLALQGQVTVKVMSVNSASPPPPTLADFELPPLPEEHQLFIPPTLRKSTINVALELMSLLNTVAPDTKFEVRLLAIQLEADHKKVYLVCNVLEAVQMMTKSSHTSYVWHGRTNLVPGLIWLRQLAEQEQVLEQLLRCWQQQQEEEPVEAQDQKLSTGVLAQKLLMVFLVAEQPRPVSVKTACRVVLGQGTRYSTGLAAARQVCGVLTAAGLLEADGGSSGPAFRYSGPEVEEKTLTQEEARRIMAAKRRKVKGCALAKDGGQSTELDTAIGSIL